jgi:hypothetical protein
MKTKEQPLQQGMYRPVVLFTVLLSKAQISTLLELPQQIKLSL